MTRIVLLKRTKKYKVQPNNDKIAIGIMGPSPTGTVGVTINEKLIVYYKRRNGNR